MSREELLAMTKDEVSTIAKEYGITRSIGSKRKTKEQLIEEILEQYVAPTQVAYTPTGVEKENTVAEVEDEDWQQSETENEVVEEVEVEEKEILTPEQKAERRKSYVENVQIGTLVAFKSITGKVKSAKVIKRSSKNRRLKVETKYGAEFVIPYDDVIWVRTNKRWPKGVYQLLKGVTNNEEGK